MKKYIPISFWKNKKVFITGHTGFKGSWLCILLNFFGAKITGYSLKPKKKMSLFKIASIDRIIEKSIFADVRNYKKLKNEIKKSNATILFHLAAQPLVKYSYMNPKETFEVNFIGTLNILEIVKCIKKIKTSIIVTTDKVYKNYKNKIFIENDYLEGLDPYSSSKVCIEHMFKSYYKSFFSKQKKQKMATVRAGNVIGGGDYSDDRLVPDIYRAEKYKKKLILRYPKSIRPWQHVIEPLNGYLLLAEKIHNLKNNDQILNWNFGPNISNCKSVSYIVRYFSKYLNFKISYLKSNNKKKSPEIFTLRLNNSKAKKYLKWKPKWSLNTSIEKTLEWHKKISYKNALKKCNEQIENYFKY